MDAAASVDHSNNPIYCKNKLSSEPKYVYIWDMDETLILLKSLLDGTYASSYKGLKDVLQSAEIGKSWENIILQVCDDCFFYEAIEEYNQPYLNVLHEYEDGRDLTNYDFQNDGLASPSDAANKRKLAYRHRIIAEKYRKGLRSIIDQHLVQLWDELYIRTDTFTDGWLSSAHKLLLEAAGAPGASNSARCRNVNTLVTSGSLVPSLAKCLLYRLDDTISHDNVYSSWEVGKLLCFTWIKQRYDGPNVRFCVIGDGFEERDAALVMGWPYIKVDFQPYGGHRFPGLTMPVMRSCIDAVYGPPTEESDSGEG